jgi:hypothetical protein
MSYIKFIERTPKKKTKVWEINTNTTPQYVIEDNNVNLGTIQRIKESEYEYSYKPSSELSYLDRDTLDQISKFIEGLEVKLLGDIYDKAGFQYEA